MAVGLQRTGLIKQHELHVATTGSDWNIGVQSQPVRTIQAALDRVATGGRVIVHPGEYAERVHLRCSGTVGRPTTLQAAEPGTVVLTWFTAPVSLAADGWTRDGNLWTRPVNWPVHRVQVGAESGYRVGSGVAGLHKLSTLPGAMTAFTYEAGQLVLFVPDEVTGTHPEQILVMWNRPVPDPREWGEYRAANLWVEASHVQIEGLDLRCGVGSSIRIWHGQDIRIRDCAFSGAQIGVNASEGVAPATNLLVERCLYHNYPQHTWRRQWLDWGNIYANYANSSLIKAVDDSTTIRDCVATHFGDGLQLSSRNSQLAEINAHGNWLAFGTDDALEAEGPVAGLKFYENVVLDCHESLGLSPVTVGPLLIERNLFLHPRVELNGAQIKFVPPKNLRREVIRNIEVRNNRFVGNWLCWYAAEVQCQHVLIHDNQFSVRRRNEPLFPAGVTAEYNAYHELPLEPATLSPLEALTAAGSDVPVDLHRAAGPSWWDWNAHLETRELGAWRAALRSLQP